jgi:hypothetical protein
MTMVFLTFPRPVDMVEYHVQAGTADRNLVLSHKQMVFNMEIYLSVLHLFVEHTKPA